MRLARALTLLVMLGCEAGTGGKLTTVELGLRSAGDPMIPLDDGSVTLTRATLSFGPLYVMEAQPPGASLWDRAMELLVPAAHAHPGHDFFSGGRVMTEWLEPVVIDLLAPNHALGRSPAIAGPARSMSIHLLRDDENGGQALRLSGTHERGGVRRPFSMDVSLPGGFDDQRVDFVAIDCELDEGRQLIVSVDPRTWFRGARFEETATDPLPADSQTVRAVQLNLRRFAAWSASCSALP